jgi:ribosomal protein L21E
MKFSWNTPQANKAKVEKQLSHFSVGDIVKITDCNNSRKGLDKNGRTGIVTRTTETQVEIQLHCTTTGGNETKSEFIVELGRYVGITNVKQWFNKNQIQLC